MVFWIGDLNYRLIGDDAVIKNLISAKKWRDLWTMDEVCESRTARVCATASV